METLSALLILYEGNPPVTGDPHSKGQWCHLTLLLMPAWSNCRTTSGEADELRCLDAHLASSYGNGKSSVVLNAACTVITAGPHPTNGSSIEFEIRSKLGLLYFKMCSTDHNAILRHTSRQLHSRDMCNISLWSVEHILNQTRGTANFGRISNSIEISWWDRRQVRFDQATAWQTFHNLCPAKLKFQIVVGITLTIAEEISIEL